MKKRRLAALLLLGLVLLVALRLVVRGGLLRSVAHVAPGPCRRLGPVPGPEDLALDRERGLLLVSSHDRRSAGALGAIYAVALGGPAAALAATRLPGPLPQGFRPHGLSLHRAADGTRRLYAVSHPHAGRRPLDFGTAHSIEVLLLRGGSGGEPLSLSPERSIYDQALINPNDVHVRGPDDLYVTRDHGATSSGGKLLEELASLPRASVLHYDGSTFRTAAQGLAYANGITGQGERLYVAGLLDRTVYEFAITGKGALSRLRALPVPTDPDNLELDEDGSLLIGAHPAPARFLLHALRASSRSPSQALRLSRDGAAQVLYADPGDELSGSSVAVRAGGLLFIGAVFDGHLIVCEEAQRG